MREKVTRDRERDSDRERERKKPISGHAQPLLVPCKLINTDFLAGGGVTDWLSFPPQVR